MPDTLPHFDPGIQDEGSERRDPQRELGGNPEFDSLAERDASARKIRELLDQKPAVGGTAEVAADWRRTAGENALAGPGLAKVRKALAGEQATEPTDVPPEDPEAGLDPTRPF